MREIVQGWYSSISILTQFIVQYTYSKCVVFTVSILVIGTSTSKKLSGGFIYPFTSRAHYKHKNVKGSVK